MKCRICNHKVSIKYKDLYDDRYGYPGEFLLAQCKSCGHKFLVPPIEENTINELYTKYYPRSKYQISQYKPKKELQGFKAWIQGYYAHAYAWVPKGVRVLDIGCGFGETLGFHKGRNCEVFGVEADENVIKVKNKFGFNIHIGTFTENLYPKGYFDYITMDQVIEHMVDPLRIFTEISRILKPKGKLIISTPNSNGIEAKFFKKKWVNWHTPYHQQFFSINSMKIALEKSGLELQKVKTITNPEWMYYQIMHLIDFPEKQKPSKFWYGKNRKSLLRNLVLFLHQKVRLSFLLTRIFDSLNIGGNYVFVIQKK